MLILEAVIAGSGVNEDCSDISPDSLTTTAVKHIGTLTPISYGTLDHLQVGSAQRTRLSDPSLVCESWFSCP